MLTDLRFAVTHTVNPFGVFPAALKKFTDPFTSSSSLTQFSETTPGSVSVTGGTATITDSGAHNTILCETSSSFDMPLIFSKIRVNSITPSSVTGFDDTAVGIVKDANNYMFATYDSLNHLLFVTVKIAGSATFNGIVSATLTAPFNLALGLVNNSASVWLDTGSGYTLMTNFNVASLYDFTATGALSGWMAGWLTSNGGGSTTHVYSSFEAGLFGTVFTRDPVLVTNKNGSPYSTAADTVTLTMTCGDTVGSGYCGVFTYNVSTNVLTQVGAIMVSRGGHVYNDLGAHILVDGSTFRLLMATWGNGFGGAINVEYMSTSTDLTTGEHVASGMTNLSLPGVTGMGYTAPGTYDQMLVWDTPNSRWLLAYIITSDTAFPGNVFFAAAAYSPDLVTWTLIGADTGNGGWEGAKIIPFFGSYCIAVGGPGGSGNDSRVYDQNMTYLGDLKATFSGGTDTQPHPMAFAFEGSEYLITFDNHKYGSTSFTWGNFIVEKAPLYSAGQPVVCTATF